MSVDSTALRRAVGQYHRRVFDSAAEAMLVDAEAAAPVDTRATVRSGKVVDREQTDVAQRARLRFNTPQAAYTNDGTRPHVIRPRNRKALAFTVGGRRIVVTKVNHPGNQATHWFDLTVTDRRWETNCQRAASQITVST